MGINSDEENGFSIVIQIIFWLFVISIPIAIIWIIFEKAIERFQEGNPKTLYFTVGISIVLIITVGSYWLDEKIGKAIRFLPKVILSIGAIAFALLMLGSILFNILRMPFVDDDASIDLGILILKSSFVKFLIVSLMIGGILFIVKSIQKKKNNDKTT